MISDSNFVAFFDFWGLREFLPLYTTQILLKWNELNARQNSHIDT